MGKKKKPKFVELAYNDGINTSIIVNFKILTLYDSMMIIFRYKTGRGDINNLTKGNSRM